MTEKAVIVRLNCGQLRLRPNSQLNVLYGLNGAGKTQTIELFRSAFSQGRFLGVRRPDEYAGRASGASFEVEIVDVSPKMEVHELQDFGALLRDRIFETLSKNFRGKEYRTGSGSDLEGLVELWLQTSIRNGPMRAWSLSVVDAIAGEPTEENLLESARESFSRLAVIAREISRQRRFTILISAGAPSLHIAFQANESTPCLWSEIVAASDLWPDTEQLMEAEVDLVYERSDGLADSDEIERIRSRWNDEFQRLADLSFVNGTALTNSDIEETSWIYRDYILEESFAPGELDWAEIIWWRLSLQMEEARSGARRGLEEQLFVILGADDFDIDSPTREVLKRAIDEATTDDEDLNSRAVSEALILASLALGERASNFFAEFLPDAHSLVVGVPTREDVLAGRNEFWRAKLVSGGEICLSDLSLASRRVAQIAISLALAEMSDINSLIVLLLDEPEMGLHREAERKFLSALASLAQKPNMIVVVTSHSPLALSTPSAILHHVTRNSRGETAVRPLPMPDREGLKAFGLSSADLLSLVRLFLVVEGHHDELVLNGLFGDCEGGFRENGVHILPMHGGRHATSVVNRNLIWDYSDAPIALLLDRVPGEALAAVWAQALLRFATGDNDAEQRKASKWFRENAPTALEGSIKGKGKADEVAWIVALGSRALESGNPERLTLLGLEADDILAYLPAGSLGEGTWLEAKRRGLSDEEIQNAVRKMEPIHSDLIHVLDACRGLTQGGAHS